MKKIRAVIVLLVFGMLNSGGFAIAQTLPVFRSFFDLLDETEKSHAYGTRRESRLN